MEKIIIDTSVAVKWFVYEEGTEEATNLMKKQRDGELVIIAPEILRIETLNALFFRGFIEEVDLKNFLTVFKKAHIKFIALQDNFLLKTQGIMNKYKLAAYDAVFIALAEQEKCTLLTADKKHHRKEISSYIQYL